MDTIAHCYKWHIFSAGRERRCLHEASCRESVQCKVICSNKLHLFCLAFKLREREEGREKKRNLISNPTHLLISICSVVFNATYWKNFNGCFAMKSFVILQRAFVSLLCDSPRVLESSRWSRSDVHTLAKRARGCEHTHTRARAPTHRQVRTLSLDVDPLASWHIGRW